MTDEGPIIERLLAIGADGGFGRYEYDRANRVLSVRPDEPHRREHWSVEVDEEGLQAYLADYTQAVGLDDPDEELTAFTLFTVDVLENMDTGRDAFQELREFLHERSGHA